jgi:hypothetical protein
MQSDTRYAALRMPTNDMRPRICVGEAVIYDTESKAEPGDDVVILLVDGGSIVRGLLGLTDDGYRLKSYSPRRRWRYARSARQGDLSGSAPRPCRIRPGDRRCERSLSAPPSPPSIAA